jgi:hypothetical protein
MALTSYLIINQEGDVMTLEEYIKSKKKVIVTRLNSISNLNEENNTIMLRRDEWYEGHGKLEAYNTVLTAIQLINEYNNKEKIL